MCAPQVGRGGGTHVAEPKLELAGLAALSDQLRAQGRRVGARVLSAEERPASSAAAAKLALDPGALVYELMRERYDDVPVRALERLEPVLASAEEAAALGIDPGGALFRVERTGYGVAGRPLEWSRDLFRGDRTRVVWESAIRPAP